MFWSFSSRAALEALGTHEAGRLARLTSESRGLWMDSGTQWFSLTGEVANVREFGAKGNLLEKSGVAISTAGSASVTGGFPDTLTGALIAVVEGGGGTNLNSEHSATRQGDGTLTISPAPSNTLTNVRVWVGSDDTAAIAAAVAASRHVHFPPGNYLVTATAGPIQIAVDGTRLTGEPGAIIWKPMNHAAPSGANAIFQVIETVANSVTTRHGDVEFIGLTFRGYQVDSTPGSNTSGPAIYLRAAERILVARCTMQDGQCLVSSDRLNKTSGQEWYQGGMFPTRHLLISENQVLNCDAMAIIQFTRRFTVANNVHFRFQRSQSSMSGHVRRGIEVRNCRTGVIGGNVLHGSSTDAILLETTGETLCDIAVAGNSIAGAHDDNFDSSSDPADDNDFDIDLTAGGIRIVCRTLQWGSVYLSGYIRNIAITANTIHRATFGVRVDVEHSNVEAASAVLPLISGITVTGNTMRHVLLGIDVNTSANPLTGTAHALPWPTAGATLAQYDVVWPSEVKRQDPGYGRFFVLTTSGGGATGTTEPTWPLSGTVTINNLTYQERGVWPWIQRLVIVGNVLDAGNPDATAPNGCGLRMRYVADCVLSNNDIAGFVSSAELVDVAFGSVEANTFRTSETASNITTQGAYFTNLRGVSVQGNIYRHQLAHTWAGDNVDVLVGDNWGMGGSAWQPTSMDTVDTTKLNIGEGRCFTVPSSSAEVWTISGYRSQRRIILRFGGSSGTNIVFKKRTTSGNLLLSADHTLNNKDTLELVSDGIYWYQVSRADLA